MLIYLFQHYFKVGPGPPCPMVLLDWALTWKTWWCWETLRKLLQSRRHDLIFPCKHMRFDGTQILKKTGLTPIDFWGTAVLWQVVLDICTSWLGELETITWILSHTLLVCLFQQRACYPFLPFFPHPKTLSFYYQNLIKLWLRKSTLLLQTIYSTINHKGVLSFSLSLSSPPLLFSPPPSPFYSIRNNAFVKNCSPGSSA